MPDVLIRPGHRVQSTGLPLIESLGSYSVAMPRSMNLTTRGLPKRAALLGSIAKMKFSPFTSLLMMPASCMHFSPAAIYGQQTSVSH